MFFSLMLRLMFARIDKKRDRGLSLPTNVSIQQNIRYGPHKEHVLDVYRPLSSNGLPLPVIVSVHGGSWIYGDKKLYRPYCMDLAQRGFAVVNFTYRLAPRYKFPCQLEDTIKAFHWVLNQGSQYGLDTNNLFAVGDSAGAQLLALACALCINSDYASTYPFSAPTGFVPRAIALNCGVYDLVSARTAFSGAARLITEVLGHPATDAELRAISPVSHLEAGFPPCYIMTANDDFLKEQPAPFIRALDERHIPYEYHCFGDDANRLGHVFHLDIRNPQAIAVNDAQCAFFRARIQ